MVIEKFPGADGLKTGHTDAAGYGITASAVQNGQRLILVLNGLRYPDLDKDSPAKQDWLAEQRRGEEAARVLGVAFREFRSYPLFKANESSGTARVWGGSEEDRAGVTAGKPIAVTLQVDSRPEMKVSVHYNRAAAGAYRARSASRHARASRRPDFPGHDRSALCRRERAACRHIRTYDHGPEGADLRQALSNDEEARPLHHAGGRRGRR